MDGGETVKNVSNITREATRNAPLRAIAHAATARATTAKKTESGREKELKLLKFWAQDLVLL